MTIRDHLGPRTDATAALHDELDALQDALVEHNDMLRSTFAIAEREGVKGMIASTNWDAFYNRVAVLLKRHHAPVNEARAAIIKRKGDD